jgi:hypothetical protein
MVTNKLIFFIKNKRFVKLNSKRMTTYSNNHIIVPRFNEEKKNKIKQGVLDTKD